MYPYFVYLEKRQAWTVRLSVDPEELQIQDASSFDGEEDLKEGVDGAKLIRYKPKKGLIIYRIEGSLEQGETHEACQSVPVEAQADGKATVSLSMADGQG